MLKLKCSFKTQSFSEASTRCEYYDPLCWRRRRVGPRKGSACGRPPEHKKASEDLVSWSRLQQSYESTVAFFQLILILRFFRAKRFCRISCASAFMTAEGDLIHGSQNDFHMVAQHRCCVSTSEMGGSAGGAGSLIRAREPNFHNVTGHPGSVCPTPLC